MLLKSKKLYGIIIVLFIFFILLIPIISAQNYYADIEITVDDSGVVNIEGISNHPNLIIENSEKYTYKKQSYWFLNITKNEEFSDYIYNLNLPEGSKINYIDASGFNSIEEEEGSLVISGSGKNEPLSIAVQYQLDNQISGDISLNNIILVGLLILIFIVLSLLIYFIYQDRKNKSKVKKEIDNKLDYDLKGLSKRQKEIVELLVDKKRPLTQTDIQKELKFPKAAVSRNVHSLELKGLVEIEKTGMSNLIRLKKP